MITSKRSILSRSSHSGERFKTMIMVEEWLKKYNIGNYTINRDLTIDVDGDVNLFKKDLIEIPDYIQFGVIRGNFDCSSNHLSSLRGCPREVGGYFDCSNNKLTSLEGSPREVGGFFDCYNNQLTTLKGSLEKAGWNFNCSHNKLISLEGAPVMVRGYFDCSHNKLISLEGAPKEIDNLFLCGHNSKVFTVNDVNRVCNKYLAISTK